MSEAHLQSEIKNWWETNPMTYDWDKDVSHEEGTRDFYQEIDGRFWAAAWFGHQPKEEPFSRLIDYADLKGKKVLEIGCGAGAITAQLAKHGAQVTAVDLTEHALRLTRRRFELFDLDGDIRQMDAEHLDFPDASFDFVWSWGVIHHSARTEDIISQIHRVLKPGGETRVMVYNRNSAEFQVGIRLIRGILMGGRLRYSLDDLANECSDGAIAKYYTPTAFKKMFSRHFERVETQVYGQKSDLWQLPHGRLKSFLINATPDSIARWVTSRFGSFLFLRATK